MHCIVNADLLPVFQLGGGVLLFPSFYVNQLIFGAGNIGNGKAGVLNYVVQHTAVSTLGELPVPHQFKVGKLLVGNDVARSVATFARCLDASVYNSPTTFEFFFVKTSPSVECLTVEE